jgi:hypothetical protein
MMISPQDNEALYYMIFKDEKPEDFTLQDEPNSTADE